MILAAAQMEQKYAKFCKIFSNPTQRHKYVSVRPTTLERNQNELHMVMMSMKPIWISLKYLGQKLFIVQKIIKKLLIKLTVFIKNTNSSNFFIREMSLISEIILLSADVQLVS